MSTPALQLPVNRELVLEEFLPYRLSILSNTISSSIAELYSNRYDLTIPEWRVRVETYRERSLGDNGLEPVRDDRRVVRFQPAGR